jgi:hypothetical protein
MLPWRWSPSPMGPTLTRTRRSTGNPTASKSRRTIRFFSGVQDHFDKHVARSGVNEAEGVHGGDTVLQLDAGLQLGADALRERAADLDQVRLGHLIGRVRQAVGEFAVVGQQQQALGGDVKASDMEKPFALVVADEVADAGPALRVLHGGDNTLGLVEHHVDQGVIELDAQAVHVDDRSLGVDADAELGDDLAVDLHAAFGDHLLADAA